MMLQLQKSNCNKHSKSTGTTKKSKQLSCFIYTKKFENSDQIEMILVLKDALKDSSTMRLGCNEGGKFPGPQFAVGSVEKYQKCHKYFPQCSTFTS